MYPIFRLRTRKERNFSCGTMNFLQANRYKHPQYGYGDFAFSGRIVWSGWKDR
jgi:hypothetical protein